MKEKLFHYFYFCLGLVAIICLWPMKEYSSSLLTAFFLFFYWGTIRKPEQEFKKSPKNQIGLVLRFGIVGMFILSQVRHVLDFFHIK